MIAKWHVKIRRIWIASQWLEASFVAVRHKSWRDGEIWVTGSGRPRLVPGAEELSLSAWVSKDVGYIRCRGREYSTTSITLTTWPDLDGWYFRIFSLDEMILRERMSGIRS